MEELAKEIVIEFEKNLPVPYEVSDWEKNSEKFLLYLAAKQYLERYSH
jgi:hypothetical protein